MISIQFGEIRFYRGQSACVLGERVQCCVVDPLVCEPDIVYH